MQKNIRNMKIQEIRNATLKITFGGKVFLIDPLFAPKDAYDPIPMCFTPDIRWPLCCLPMPVGEIIKGVDAVIMTHYHIDHFDEYAAKILPKKIKIFAQDSYDQKILENLGFKDTEIVSETGTIFGDVKLYKTGCMHGIEETTMPYFKAAGIRHEAMGIVFKSDKEKTLYIAGDTIWHDCVKKALDKFKPDIAVLNSADARFEHSGSIIMGTRDIAEFHKYAPSVKLVASHMDTVAHATLDRKALKKFTEENGLSDSLVIPSDGEILEF